MQTFDISVLMSVYEKDNSEYVANSIESILHQTLMPKQIVILADGKLTDELYEILKKYEINSLFDIHYRDNNIGLGLTLNEGLNYCKYEFIARMDSDDICVPTRFKKQIDIFKKDDSIDIVGTNIDEYDENMKVKLSSRIVPETNDLIKKYAKRRNPMNHVSVMYKKSKVIDSGNYIDCPLFEDYYLWSRMIMNNCIFYNIQESLVHVRTGNNMIERRGGFNYVKKIVNFEKKIYKIGLINRYEYLRNIVLRITVAIIPSNIRKFVYFVCLRKEKNNNET